MPSGAAVEGTGASQWAQATPTSVPPVRQASKDSNEGSNTRGGRNGKRRSKTAGGRKQSGANTAGAPSTNAAPAPPAPAEAPTPLAPESTDAPKKKLIDRLSAAPEANATSAPSTKTDTPAQVETRGGRSRRDRPSARKKAPTNRAGRAPVAPKQSMDQELEATGTKDASHDTESISPPIADGVSDLADKFNTLTVPSMPTTPRPYTPSAIDWAGDTEDGSLPDLDDWGVHPTKPATLEEPIINGEDGAHNNTLAHPGTHATSNGSASAVTPLHTSNEPNDSRRHDSTTVRGHARDSLSVPNRNANGHSSSRPVTPSTGTASSPSLRGRRRHEGTRASSRASIINDPPHITVTSNPNAPTADKGRSSPPATSLDLNPSEVEPVFASLNDPPPPPPEEPHIRPIRAPDLNEQRGVRGRGGRGRGGNIHGPPSPYMPPSPFSQSSGFGTHQQHPHGGYAMGHPYGYGSPGDLGQSHSFSGHQHSRSHPPPTQSPRGHARTHSRPVLTGNALSILSRTLQGTPTQKPKADVSTSS